MSNSKDPSTNIPERGTSAWRKNESIINKHPALKRARDTAEGFKPSSGITQAPVSAEYKANYDNIDWSVKSDSKPSFRTSVNGRYTDGE